MGSDVRWDAKVCSNYAIEMEKIMSVLQIIYKKLNIKNR